MQYCLFARALRQLPAVRESAPRRRELCGCGRRCAAKARAPIFFETSAKKAPLLHYEMCTPRLLFLAAVLACVSGAAPRSPRGRRGSLRDAVGDGSSLPPAVLAAAVQPAVAPAAAGFGDARMGATAAAAAVAETARFFATGVSDVVAEGAGAGAKSPLDAAASLLRAACADQESVR